MFEGSPSANYEVYFITSSFKSLTFKFSALGYQTFKPTTSKLNKKPKHKTKPKSYNIKQIKTPQKLLNPKTIIKSYNLPKHREINRKQNPGNQRLIKIKYNPEYNFVVNP